MVAQFVARGELPTYVFIFNRRATVSAGWGELVETCADLGVVVQAGVDTFFGPTFGALLGDVRRRNV